MFWVDSAIVIYYHYLVPEGERHDSAIKRNREALSAEVKLWESYLEKVTLAAQGRLHLCHMISCGTGEALMGCREGTRQCNSGTS